MSAPVGENLAAQVPPASALPAMVAIVISMRLTPPLSILSANPKWAGSYPSSGRPAKHTRA